MIFHSNPILEIELPIRLKTQNTGRGGRWQKTDRLRKAYEAALLDYRREPFEHPVAVLYTRVLGARETVWDNDNVGMACKQLQDALTALGWWHDDSDRWLRLVGYRHDKTRRRDGPAVMVSVFGDGGLRDE